MGVSGKEFAAIRGVDPSRVSQWKRQGRLILDADGKIDAAATNAALDASLDKMKGLRRSGNVTSSSPAIPGLGGNGKGQEQAHQAQGEREPDAGDRGHGGKGGSGYWWNKSKREAAEAQLAEMKVLREAAALTPTAGIRKEATETARRTSNAMLAIPDRSATVLASMTSPAEIHRYLTGEIQKALRELGVELEQRAAAAARADEPDPALV